MKPEETHDAILTAIQGIQGAMERHFEDDKESFAKIDNNQKRFQEINAQNGEHFSHFNANILTLTSKIEKHMQRVEPMLLSYEDGLATGRTIGGWGKKIGVIAGFIAGLYVIRDFIVNHVLSK